MEEHYDTTTPWPLNRPDPPRLNRKERRAQAAIDRKHKEAGK